MVTRSGCGGCDRAVPRPNKGRGARASWVRDVPRWGRSAYVGGSRRWSEASPRGGRRGAGHTSSRSRGRRTALPLPPRRPERAVGLAALEQQLVVHGQFTDFRPHSGDLVVLVVGRPALQGGLATGQEVVPPPGQSAGGHAEFTRDQFQVFAAEEADDGSGLTLGGEAATFAGVRGAGHD